MPDNSIRIGSSLFRKGEDLSLQPKQTILHELVHRLDYQGEGFSEVNDRPGLISSHPYFRLLSEKHASSGYSMSFNKSSGDYLTENLAEATMMMYLAQNKNTMQHAFIEKPAEIGVYGKKNEDISYSEWKRINPELDEIGKTIYNSRSTREIMDFLDNKMEKYEQEHPHVDTSKYYLL